MSVARRTYTSFHTARNVQTGVRATRPARGRNVAASWGYLRHLSGEESATMLGVASTNSWRWEGPFPHGTIPRTGWFAEAYAEGEPREFNIESARQDAKLWILDMAEVR